MSLARLLCTACGSRALTELTKYYDERIEPPKPDLIRRKAGVRAGPQIPFRVWMICGLAVPTLLNCFDSREYMAESTADH